MNRRYFLALVGVAAGAGCGGDGDYETGNDGTPQPKERARQAATQGLTSGDAWSDGLRDIDFRSMVDGGFSIDVRYNLDYSTLGGEFTAAKAEKRAGWTAWAVLKRLAAADIADLQEVGIFAYVPTGEDKTVSTKVVMSMETAERIDWGATTWEIVRERAEQYRFNEYLYG